MTKDNSDPMRAPIRILLIDILIDLVKKFTDTKYTIKTGTTPIKANDNTSLNVSRLPVISLLTP